MAEVATPFIVLIEKNIYVGLSDPTRLISGICLTMYIQYMSHDVYNCILQMFYKILQNDFSSLFHFMQHLLFICMNLFTQMMYQQKILMSKCIQMYILVANVL